MSDSIVPSATGQGNSHNLHAGKCNINMYAFGRGFCRSHLKWWWGTQKPYSLWTNEAGCSTFRVSLSFSKRLCSCWSFVRASSFPVISSLNRVTWLSMVFIFLFISAISSWGPDTVHFEGRKQRVIIYYKNIYCGVKLVVRRFRHLCILENTEYKHEELQIWVKTVRLIQVFGAICTFNSWKNLKVMTSSIS